MKPMPMSCLAILAAAAAVSAQALARPVFLVNESRSLPRGLYLQVLGRPPAMGDIVAAAPPRAAQAYLAGLGAPQGAWLLKRVAAAGGHTICAAGDHIRLPSGSVTALRQDRQNQALPRWTGCQVLAAGQVFLLGDSPASFDSRYFGPVDLREVKGVYRQVLTW